MSARTLKKSESATGVSASGENLFITANGLRKRQIYYNVEYTRQEGQWIRDIRLALRDREGYASIEDQVLLRYYYSSDMILEKCLERLAKYRDWFGSAEIQSVGESAKAILRQGFVYYHGKAKDGRVFIVMNLSLLHLEKYSESSYFQAMNHVFNRVIREEFVPGVLETYYLILDLDEQLLSLPLSSLGDIIKVLANAYSMCLEDMLIVNCTALSKWIFNRVKSFIAEETLRKISLYTREELAEGQLLRLIDATVLERKYGGTIHVSHSHLHLLGEEEMSESEYFSIEGEEQGYYKESSCCLNECRIY